jgi:phenylalanyl-tRNA synthetase beta chain
VRVRGQAGERSPSTATCGSAREDLVIADAEGAVAVAGVMGGADSEVTSATREILLESAYFDPPRVRRTAKRLGLSSDASYRFERGVDPDGQVRAVDRAARLIAELSGGEVASGVVEALGEPVPQADPIPLAPARANRLLGTSLAPAEVQALLARVEVKAEPTSDGAFVCAPALPRTSDPRLAEEIARIQLRRHPSTPPGAREGVSPRRARRARRFGALAARISRR